MPRNILFFFIVLIFSSCVSDNTVDQQTESSLQFAGNNRTELEKVLKYYKNDPQKLEAAKFLIRNMPHWYSYEGSQLDSIQTVLAYIANTPKLYAMTEIQKRRWQGFPFYSLPKIYDSHIITAEFLINNITHTSISSW